MVALAPAALLGSPCAIEYLRMPKSTTTMHSATPMPMIHQAKSQMMPMIISIRMALLQFCHIAAQMPGWQQHIRDNRSPLSNQPSPLRRPSAGPTLNPRLTQDSTRSRPKPAHATRPLGVADSKPDGVTERRQARSAAPRHHGTANRSIGGIGLQEFVQLVRDRPIHRVAYRLVVAWDDHGAYQIGVDSVAYGVEAVEAQAHHETKRDDADAPSQTGPGRRGIITVLQDATYLPKDRIPSNRLHPSPDVRPGQLRPERQ